FYTKNMSTNANSKKSQNYSALLGEMKASSLNEKIKGRNYKMYIKRGQTSSVDKSDTIGMKSINYNQSSDKLSDNMMTHTNVTNVSNMNSSKVNLVDKRILEKRKGVGSHSISGVDQLGVGLGLGYNKITSVPSTTTNNMGNKIDIKISVNY